MIPVDAQIWTEAMCAAMVSASRRFLGEINSRGAGVKIALVDASRRNPSSGGSAAFGGASACDRAERHLVMYSAALSSVVGDNGGDHSLSCVNCSRKSAFPT